MANARTDWFLTPYECRFAWQHLDLKKSIDFQGNTIPPDDRQYEVTILVPKTHADPRQCRGYAALNAKVWEAAQAQWKGQWKQGARHPITDGDEPSKAEKYPFMKGHWLVTARSNFAPKVIGMDFADIPKDLEGKFRAFKSGDYGMASLNCWAYDTGTGGVNFGIEGVKKSRDGDAIGGGQRSTEEMFGGSPPAASSAPPLPPQAAGGYGAPPAPPPQPAAPPPAAPSYPSAPQSYQPSAPAPVSPYPGYRFDTVSVGWVPDNPPPFQSGPAPYAPTTAYAAPTGGAPVPSGMPPPGPGNAAYPSSAPPGPPGMPPPPPMPPFGTR